jgi:ParB family chromosome partitioning protein
MSNPVSKQAEQVLREDIRKVHPDPNNPRKSKSPEYIQRLADSIARDGQRIPGIARPHPDIPGEWMLIEGHCRLEAQKLRGLTTFDLIPKPGPMSESEILAFQMDTGVICEKLSPSDLADALKRWMVLEQITSQTEAAKRRGVSQGTVSRILSIDLLAPDLKPQVDSFAVCPSIAYQIASLPSHEHQRVIMKRAMEGKLTRDQVKSLIDTLKGNKPKGPKALKGKEGKRRFAIDLLPGDTHKSLIDSLKAIIDKITKAQTAGVEVKHLSVAFHGGA